MPIIEKLIEKGAWYFAPLSIFYQFVVVVRNRLFDFGFFSSKKVDCVVVSVGNVLAGGTGKTPLVHLIARMFPSIPTAILSRGYGKIPDEALMLKKKLPNVSFYIGANRVKSAEKAQFDGAKLIILDDGFQHRWLHRDFDLVIIKKKKEHFLPWGFLRDDPNRIQKADAIFSQDQIEKVIGFKKTVVSIKNQDGKNIESIKDMHLGIFCGIGSPNDFRKTVLELGAIIEKEHILADHAKVKIKDLDPNIPWICTEKDAVKLEKNDLSILVLEIQLEIISEKEKFNQLIQNIKNKLDTIGA